MQHATDNQPERIENEQDHTYPQQFLNFWPYLAPDSALLQSALFTSSQ